MTSSRVASSKQTASSGYFEAMAARLLIRAETLLVSWFPAGKRRGREFVVGNLAGAAGDSLSVNLDSGRWADFATGQKGGDLVSLFAAIHGISQGEAARRLDDGTPQPKRQRRPTADRERKKVVAPVPDSAPACSAVHYKHGKPVKIWSYRGIDGSLLGHVARYEIEDGKEILPWTWSGEKWQLGSWPAPRPLYGLETLAQRHPETPILVVEGEKAADAARSIAGKLYIVVTWPSGALSWKLAKWDRVHGRHVLLWPDADEPGVKCMWEIGHFLLEHCPEVKIILPGEDLAKGWDAADALKEGWTWEKLAAWARPRSRSVDGSIRAETAPMSPAEPTPAKIEDAPAQTHNNGAGGQVARWLAWGLDQNGRGEPLNTLKNATLAIENDDAAPPVWYDEFMGRVLTGVPPRAREWTDADDLALTYRLQDYIGMTKVSREIAQQAAMLVAFRRVHNCVKDWLNSLSWDQETRLDHFFEDHFGAEASEYARAASRNFWLSIVARVYRPGCKVDNMIVLEGAQGIRKSSALQAIGGDWFTEQHETVTGKGFFEVLQGKLVVEIAELDSFNRADITRVKQVVSCPSDRFRESYGRYAKDHPRQCVFVGTTNKDDWNKDETGARRFWPIACRGDIDLEEIKRSREQLFAEAAARFKAGETWWNMPADETRTEQEKRYEGDAWEESIAEFCKLRTNVSVKEILLECLKLDEARIDRLCQMRVSKALKHRGWVRKKKQSGWRYEKDEKEHE